MSVRLVLASGSPRRAAVLRQLGLDPLVRPSDVDEAYRRGETPAEHVERLARAKAEAVWSGADDELVIGGDTVVVHEERVLGKPSDEADARTMLARLSGDAHDVLSGLALVGAHGTVSSVSRTTVRFRALDPAWAALYVATGEPLDKAGAYGIQGLGAVLVSGIDGDYYTVVGFPLQPFVELLDRAGWRYDFGAITRAAG